MIFTIGLFYVLFRSKPVQSWLVNKATHILSDKLGTKVRVGAVDIDFFKTAILEDIYIEDQRQDTLFYFRKLKVDYHTYDENKHIIKLNYVGIEGAKVLFGEHKGDTVNNYDFFIDFFNGGPRDPSKPKVIWTVTSKLVELERSRFDYYAGNASKPDFMDFDYNNMSFTQIEASFKDFSLVDDSLHFFTDHLETTERSGFRVDHIAADTKIHEGGIEFDQLTLLTPRSTIGDKFIMQTKDWKDYNDFNNKVKLIANIKKSDIHSKDLAFFSNRLKVYDTKIFANGSGEGFLSRLKGKNTELKLFNGTVFRGDWTMTGLPDFDNTILDFTVDLFRTDYKDLNIISEGNIPDNFKSLGQINYNGMFSGFYNDFITFGTIETDIGNFESDINIKFKEGLDLAKYSGTLKTNQFFIRNFIPEASIDEIAFDLNVKGTGLSRNTYNIEMDGDIDKLKFLNYTYTQIKAKGIVSKESFSGSAEIRDENLNMDFDGEFLNKGALPKASFKAVVYHSNLATLGFDTTEQNIDGVFELDFTGKDLDNAQGSITGYNVRVKRNNSTVFVPMIRLSAVETDNTKELILTSDVVDARISGLFTLKKIDVSIMHMLHQLIPAYFSKPSQDLPNEDFVFNFDLKKPFAITSLYQPQLKLEPCTGDGFYRSADQTIRFTFFNELIEYDDLKFANVNLVANKLKDKRLKIDVGAKSFTDNNVLHINDIRIVSDVYDNNIDFNIKGIDTGLNVSIEAKGDIVFVPDSILMYLTDVDLTVSEDIWQLDTNALCVLTGDKFFMNNFMFINQKQQIALNGEFGGGSNNEMRFDVKDFALSTINYFVATSSIGKLGGDASGNIVYKYEDQTNKYSSDLKISQFAIGKDTLGDFKLTTENIPNSSRQKLQLQVKSGLLDDMQVAGEIDYLSKKNNLNLFAILPKTELRVFEPYLVGVASNFKGQIYSKDSLKISGKFNDPVVVGKLVVEDAEMKIDYLNVLVKFDTEIESMKNFISFGPMIIRDDRGKTANAKGHISHKSFDQLNFNLNLWGLNQFHVLNTTKADNELYYGQAFASGDASFNGPFDNLDIRINAKTMPGTKFYLPISEGDASGFPSYVHFKSNKKKVSRTQSDFPIRSLVMDIEATRDAEIEIIFDETMGDKISGTGVGNITMEMNKSADFYMFGTYRISSGQYLFTAFDLYNKKFNFREGGTITFYGDPFDAKLNLVAYNRELASPDPLLEAVTVATPSSSNQSQTKQKITVESELYLKGNLFSPEVTFGLNFPNLQQEGGNYTSSLTPIINRIKADKEEVNRQVFSLLLMKQFLTPTFAQSTSGLNNAGSTALSSAGSDLLSAQLSNWLNKIDPNWKVNIIYKNGTAA
ncbi:MAG TPA: translocation/assembly module TamB domain-containing protein, partial [Bacteroidia bacterium]